ncbi:fucolectin-5-like [Macrobrachium rosenbergii]|uniref:fucolectin-5-like n=1 Tax=Macrobrachium rosenbergii TaxID=79674 RepID=UPI0034D54E7C
MTTATAQANSTYYLLPDEPKAFIASNTADILTSALQLNSSTFSPIQANNLPLLRCSSEAWRVKAVGWSPGLAVDGVLSDASMYHSNLALKPWWQVDLLEERRIYQIQIYPRQDVSYYMRFHNVEVRIGKTYEGSGNFSSYGLLCNYTKTYTLPEGHLLCSRYGGVVGRYISVQITAAASEYLQIIDVSVFAYKKSALTP